MSSARRPLHRVVVSLLLLLTIGIWHVEAIAGQLSLSWVDNSTNELGFLVERSTGTTGAFAQITTTGAGITTYTDPTVADGTTYCYRVRAYNAAADSTYSNVACGSSPGLGYSVAVVKVGLGSGTVISTPSGIICGSTCSASYASGTAVTLTATPATGSVFTGWSGGGCGGTATCTVTLTALTTVQATFDLASSPTITVGKAGTGTGTVTSTPTGIDCGSTCSAGFPYGTAVTLTAAPATGSTFAGWSGACTGTGTCSVTLTSASAVTATFTLESSQSATLTVSLAGKGTVTSAPAGIECGTICSASYPSGTVVSLGAVAGTNFVFKGWGGACQGTGTWCTVTMTTATTVTATFSNVNKK